MSLRQVFTDRGSYVSLFLDSFDKCNNILALLFRGKEIQCETCRVVLLDFSLYVKAAALIFISGCGLAISSAKEGKSGFIYNLVKS